MKTAPVNVFLVLCLMTTTTVRLDNAEKEQIRNARQTNRTKNDRNNKNATTGAVTAPASKSCAIVHPPNDKYDEGYGDLPRAKVDVNGDRCPDYCRFVGDAPYVFLSCHLAGSLNQYGFNSVRGVDKGISCFKRWFEDANGDGRADYCRYVGDVPDVRKSCLLAGDKGFKGEYPP